VLAYVFWHRPAAGTDTGAYEAALTGFHATLAGVPSPGFGGSCVVALESAAWLEGDGPAYEDWYLVADWAALGELNAHAARGPRAAAHDAAAAAAATGAGGVSAPVAGPGVPPATAWRGWVGKPARMRYPDFHAALAAALPPGAAAWQRQMTLGPAGEYVIAADEPVAVPWPVRACGARVVVPC
jgi:hypothetical protein